MMNLTSKEPYESAYSNTQQFRQVDGLIGTDGRSMLHLSSCYMDIKKYFMGIKNRSNRQISVCQLLRLTESVSATITPASISERENTPIRPRVRGPPRKLAALQNTNKPYRAEPISRSRRTSAHKCYLLPSNRRVTYASVISQPHDLGSIHEIRFISHSSAISEQWRSSGDDGRPNSIRKWTAAEYLRQDAPGGHNHPTRLHLLLCIRIIIL